MAHEGLKRKLTENLKANRIGYGLSNSGLMVPTTPKPYFFLESHVLRIKDLIPRNRITCRFPPSLGPNGEPSLNLFDEKSILRTAVGAVTIKLPESGKTKNLSSAMVVFDEKGNVLWSALNPVEQ